MGQFTIVLSNNQRAGVTSGTIRKKASFWGLFRKKESRDQVKKGYIVALDPEAKNPILYRLLRNESGNWTSESVGGFPVSPDDQISIEMKKVIDAYESRRKTV